MTVGVIFALLASSIQLGLGGQAAKQGREGNGNLKAEQYGEASEAYKQGLSVYAGGREADDTYFGLQNNLGVSLFRQEELEQAQAAFDAALAHAPTDLERARAAYNAGNTAFSQQAADAALAHYRSALLADPASEDARFNYEFVKRWIQEQEQQQQQSDDNQQDDQEQDQNQQNQQGQQQQDEEQPQQESEPEQQPQGSGDEAESDARPQESNDTQLTRQQAEQILEALENEEQELLREVQKVQGTRRRVAKDW